MRPPTLPTIVTMGGIVVVHNAGELIKIRIINLVSI